MALCAIWLSRGLAVYSVGSFVTGLFPAGVWVALCIRPPGNWGEGFAALLIVAATFLGSGAGLVLAGAGLCLQQARRWALAAIVLNLVPWCVVGKVWLLGW